MTASRALPVAFATLLLAPLALSRSGFEAQAYRVFKLERVPQSALATAQCQICHVNAKGDAPWNPFGLAVGFWRGKKQSIQDALYNAVRYGGDSDRDGYPDALERMAGTNPDDRDSKPSASLEDLKKQFDANFTPSADSDRDGYADALEVFAGTLPGDANSKPTQSVSSLEARFDAAGGIAQFAPAQR
jgi:mono/diheme cytochrome c family protein